MVMAWLGETLFKMVRVYVTVKVTVLPLLTKVKVFFPGLSVTSTAKPPFSVSFSAFPFIVTGKLGSVLPKKLNLDSSVVTAVFLGELKVSSLKVYSPVITPSMALRSTVTKPSEVWFCSAARELNALPYQFSDF